MKALTFLFLLNFKHENVFLIAEAFGTKCAVCNQYVEGEVVSTMGNTYHQKCFTCTRCKQPFESGSKVKYSINTVLICMKLYCILNEKKTFKTNDFSQGHQYG